MTSTATPARYANLGAALRQAREDAGLSQAALAERIALPQSSVSGWETGRACPRLTHLFRLCAALDVAPAVLLDAARLDAPSATHGLD